MTLIELQKTFKEDASILGEYGLISKTELANGYCDADEAWDEAKEVGDLLEMAHQDRLRSAYFSALMLRYWYKIFEWMTNSASLLAQPEEYVDWLSESLSIAFRYRVWRYPFKAIWGKHSHEVIGYKLDENGERIPNPYYWETDPNAPDKIFNRCIFSARGRAYQFSNKQKRKGDVHKLSLDSLVSDDGDFALAYTGAITEEEPLTDATSELIQTLVNRGNVVEALIIDGVAHWGTFKSKKKDPDESLDTRKLVQHFNSLDSSYFKEFCDQYHIRGEGSMAEVQRFKTLTNARLYKYIERAFTRVKQDPSLLQYLL